MCFAPTQNEIRGTSASELRCLNCGVKRYHDEHFYCLSLEVKNLKGVYPSLEDYIKMDHVTGYRCDDCHETVGACSVVGQRAGRRRRRRD